MRFKTSGRWSFIPGPTHLSQPISSLDLNEIAAYSPGDIATTFYKYPNMILIHDASPSWWEWRVRCEMGRDYLEAGMTLFGDEPKSWGGSPLLADRSLSVIQDLWSHLRAQHPGIWLHNEECTIHTPVSLRALISEQS